MSLHTDAVWDGADPLPSRLLPTPQRLRTGALLPSRATCMGLTRCQVVFTPWAATGRFPLGVVTQRSPESSGVWGVLGGSWGFFMGLHRRRCSCYREAGWGQGRATRPRSRDLPLTSGVTPGWSPPRWASVSRHSSKRQPVSGWARPRVTHRIRGHAGVGEGPLQMGPTPRGWAARSPPEGWLGSLAFIWGLE